MHLVPLAALYILRSLSKKLLKLIIWLVELKIKNSTFQWLPCVQKKWFIWIIFVFNFQVRVTLTSLELKGKYLDTSHVSSGQAQLLWSLKNWFASEDKRRLEPVVCLSSSHPASSLAPNASNLAPMFGVKFFDNAIFWHILICMLKSFSLPN